jgi:hypothetical protein
MLTPPLRASNGHRDIGDPAEFSFPSAILATRTVYVSARFKQVLVRELLENGDVPKSPLPSIGSPDAVGRHNLFHIPVFAPLISACILHARGLLAGHVLTTSFRRVSAMREERPGRVFEG